jgi:iron complex transport system ATP-binding protein
VSITLQNLGVRYGAHVALADVSFTAQRGRVTAVCGPNGSGKSSLVRAVAGLTPSTGSIGLDDPAGGGGRPRVGYMPQDITAPPALSVIEVVLLGRLSSLALRIDPADLEAAAGLLDRLGIAPLANRDVRELSGGQRQLVFLGQALCGSPGVILLDEPTSALDLRHQLQVLSLLRELVRERGLTCLVVLHDLNAAARYADDVALLAGGRLVGFGPPAGIFTRDSVARAFGVEAAVGMAPDGCVTVTALRPLGGEMPA